MSKTKSNNKKHRPNSNKKQHRKVQPTKAQLKAKQERKEARIAKRMQELGLVRPQTVAIGDKAFIKLQKQWYGKLKADGFDDIEWFDAKTGKGQNSDYLKEPDQMKAKSYKPQTEFYYSMCRNYMTHNEIKPKRMQYIFELYTEGMVYREIRKAVVRRFQKYVSLYYIFYHVNRMIALMVKFNKEHKEGLLYESPETLEQGMKFASETAPKLDFSSLQ